MAQRTKSKTVNNSYFSWHQFQLETPCICLADGSKLGLSINSLDVDFGLSPKSPFNLSVTCSNSVVNSSFFSFSSASPVSVDHQFEFFGCCTDRSSTKNNMAAPLLREGLFGKSAKQRSRSGSPI